MSDIYEDPHWEVGGYFGNLDFLVLLKALPELLPRNAILTFHEMTFGPEFRSELEEIGATFSTVGGWFSKSARLNLPINESSMKVVASLYDALETPVYFFSITAAADDVTLLEWHSVPDNYVYIALSIPEEKVARLTERLGANFATYRRGEGN